MCYYDVTALNGGVFSQKATQRYNDSNVFASLVDVIFATKFKLLVSLKSLGRMSQKLSERCRIGAEVCV